MIKLSEKELMNIAINEANKGITLNDGGPFGAIILDINGNIISKNHNEVIKTNDPTAHAEILAIREASAKLKRFDLSDCIIYSSCEPCPMCLSAIYWAKIKKLFYGCTKEDAAKIGFDDKFIYDVFEGKKTNKQQVISKQICQNECLESFKKWKEKEDKIRY